MYPQYTIIESESIEDFGSQLITQQVDGFQPHLNLIIFMHKDGNHRYAQQLVKEKASTPAVEPLGLTKAQAYEKVSSGNYKIRHSSFIEDVYLIFNEGSMYLTDDLETALGTDLDQYWAELFGVTYANYWLAELRED